MEENKTSPIVTIQEEYTIPSMGKMYGKPFDPQVKLRSMTVAEEMKRLSRSENPYKTMCEIIDSCILTKLPLSVYDMCLGDYQYLLQKLRIVTYGNQYNLQYLCPICGKLETAEVDLESININRFDDSIKNDMEIVLPTTQKVVRLRFQTPRDLDKIEQKKKEIMEKSPECDDPTILLTLASFIDTIDGEPLNPILGLEALKRFPLKDMNYLSQKATKLNGKVGIDPIIETKCNSCHNKVKINFRYTQEFFGPTVD